MTIALTYLLGAFAQLKHASPCNTFVQRLTLAHSLRGVASRPHIYEFQSYQDHLIPSGY